jgi:hypothetical protein
VRVFGSSPNPPRKGDKSLNLSEIVIIGCGTLGGHLCKHLAESSAIDKLTLIDPDIVESKDTEIGVFRPIDIQEQKVHVLSRMFSNYKVEINPIVKYFMDGTTELPEADLVVDCRNMFGKRDIRIDIKTYINEKLLILDFQKQKLNEAERKGDYIIKLNKYEINRAAYYTTDLLLSNVLDELLKSQSIKYIDIDIIQSVMLKDIKLCKQSPEIIYDLDENACRLLRVDEVMQPIIDKNQEAPLKVRVQNRQTLVREVFDMPKFAPSHYDIVPKNSINEPVDVLNLLKKAIQHRDKNVRFMPVLVGNEIRILEQSGGA